MRTGVTATTRCHRRYYKLILSTVLLLYKHSLNLTTFFHSLLQYLQKYLKIVDRNWGLVLLAFTTFIQPILY